MTIKPHFTIKRSKGMTLMETVIAIGVIGFTIPMILSGTTASLNDRRNAESDTRSAWIAQDLEQQIEALWASPRQSSDLPTSLTLDFPVNGTADSPLVFIYDSKGKFLKEGTSENIAKGVSGNDAQYLVTFYSTSHNPSNLTSASSSSTFKLCRAFIKVEYPAQARQERRQASLFSTLKTKQAL